MMYLQGFSPGIIYDCQGFEKYKNLSNEDCLDKLCYMQTMDYNADRKNESGLYALI